MSTHNMFLWRNKEKYSYHQISSSVLLSLKIIAPLSLSLLTPVYMLLQGSPFITLLIDRFMSETDQKDILLQFRDNFFSIFVHKTCGYSLKSPRRYSWELPQQGDSNEYPQHLFLWRTRKLLLNYHLIPTLSVSLFMIKKHSARDVS